MTPEEETSSINFINLFFIGSRKYNYTGS